MNWLSPIPFRLIPTSDSNSWERMKSGETGLPLKGHCGSFGFRRTNHVHEGVDLYCPERTPVVTVETGRVLRVLPFTGRLAGSPWWEETSAVLVEGVSGVVVYGEIVPREGLHEDRLLPDGALVGGVKRVLRKFKGRPTSMLHLELHVHGTRDVYEWPVNGERPASLLDPTPLLLTATGFY